MKMALPFLVVAACLALGACENNTEPTKANTDTVNKNPPVDQDARPKSTTGGDQPATVPQK
jgi:ABC-type enterochelin transport system substrate-binding protein